MARNWYVVIQKDTKVVLYALFPIVRIPSNIYQTSLKKTQSSHFETLLLRQQTLYIIYIMLIIFFERNIITLEILEKQIKRFEE